MVAHRDTEKDNRTIPTRRQLLAGAAGALGVIAVRSLAETPSAEATQGQPAITGQDNTETNPTSFTNTSIGIAISPGLIATGGANGSGVVGIGSPQGTAGVEAHGTGFFPGVSSIGGPSAGVGVAGDGGANSGVGVWGTGGLPDGLGTRGLGKGTGPGVEGTGGTSGGTGVQGFGGTSGGTGVRGTGATTGPGVFGIGGPTSGTGVIGNGGASSGIGVLAQGGPDNGTGLRAFAAGSGIGVHAICPTAAGTGLLVQNTDGGKALEVQGTAVFSRSGLATVPLGAKRVVVTGVSLTASSLVLGLVQQNNGGAFVKSAVPDVSNSQFTINLNKVAPVDVDVAWFVVN